MKKAVFSLLSAALLCSAVPTHAFVPEAVETVSEKSFCEFGGAWIYQNISETYKKEAVADNFKGDPWNTDSI